MHRAHAARQILPGPPENAPIERRVGERFGVASADDDRAPRERAFVVGELDLVHRRARTRRRRAAVEHPAHDDLRRHRRDPRAVVALGDEVPRARGRAAGRIAAADLDEHAAAPLAETQHVHDAMHERRERREGRKDSPAHGARERAQSRVQERRCRRRAGPDRAELRPHRGERLEVGHVDE